MTGTRPRLIVREAGRVPVTVDVRDGLVIGRQDGCDLVVGDRQASRQHARFAMDARSAVTVVDLGSTHGTWVNGVRVGEGGKKLIVGDVVQIGNVLVELGEKDASEPDLVTTVTPRPPEGEGGDARKLRLLYDVSKAIGAGGDPEVILGSLLDAVLRLMGCERGVIGLLGGDVGAGRRIARGGDPIVPQAAIDTVKRRRESSLISGVRSAVCAPLVSGDRLVGYVYIDDQGRAMPLGASDLEFLAALGHLFGALVAAAENSRRDAAALEAMREAHAAPEIIGDSQIMKRIKEKLVRFAAADAAVLVRGESGTGKELAAATLHARSPRASQPFVAVNCAAIPDTLIEAELFGYERGAFTGAQKAKRGKFAMAHNGTLFLDEIGDLSLAAQAKVLRAIETGEVQPLGSEDTNVVDVRVVSATHKALDKEIAGGRFREDLYYRLSVCELELPPLRERGEDVLLLAQAFLTRAAGRLARPRARLSADAQAVLRAYAFPGNVRQLANEIERAVILSDADDVELWDLEERVGRPRDEAAPQRLLPREGSTSQPMVALGSAPSGDGPLASRWANLDVEERRLVEEALAKAGGNLSEAARLLGVSRVVLKRRMERYGLER